MYQSPIPPCSQPEGRMIQISTAGNLNKSEVVNPALGDENSILRFEYGFQLTMLL